MKHKHRRGYPWGVLYLFCCYVSRSWALFSMMFNHFLFFSFAPTIVLLLLQMSGLCSSLERLFSACVCSVPLVVLFCLYLVCALRLLGALTTGIGAHISTLVSSVAGMHATQRKTKLIAVVFFEFSER